MEPLTGRFKELPINSYDRLEKTIDLVFEKVKYIKMCIIYIFIILYSFNYLKHTFLLSK